MKAVTTPVLELAYEEHGDREGRPIVLVHGWPDDVRTWDEVVPELVAAGARVLVPYVRGFGPTRFRSGAFVGAETTALGRDIVDFADALTLDRFTLVGHDWGARAAYVAAVLAPERITGLVALSVGYGTNVPAQRLSFEQTRRYWYQWLFATERGEAILRDDLREFVRQMWRLWSPDWRFDDAELDRTLESFANPDWVAVTLHSYRARWGFAPNDPRYAADRERVDVLPSITVPTTVLHGSDDGATLPETSADKERFFTGGYERHVLEGVGHFIPRERPRDVAGAVLARYRV